MLKFETVTYMKSRKRITFCRQSLVVLLILNIVFLPVSQAITNCNLLLEHIVKVHPDAVVQKTQERLFGKDVAYTRIDTKHGKDRAKASQLFSEPNSIYFAFNEFGHSYVVAGHYRFDGDILYTINNFNSKSDLLDKGIVIRIPLTQEQRESLDSVLSNPEKFASLTCVGAACNALKQTYGIKFRTGKFPITLRPRSAIGRIIRDGLIDNKGALLPVELYLLNSDSMGASLRRFRNKEWKSIALLAALTAYLPFLAIILSQGTKPTPTPTPTPPPPPKTNELEKALFDQLK